uniref:NLR family CARD domain-containing protein 3-like n=1 Tax=Astyanax mexicanus TaxID=7994 RepID=W5LD72_ASTMX
MGERRRAIQQRIKHAEPPEPSCVSMKSDRSMEDPLVFSSGRGEPSCVSIKSDGSMWEPLVFSSGREEPSCVSMKSDRSMEDPLVFSSGRGEPSCVSIKSDGSMWEPLVFSSGTGEPSCVSIKSDGSMWEPLVFSSGTGEPSCVSIKSDGSMWEPLVFSSGTGEPSSVPIRSDQSMKDPPVFSSEAEPSDPGQGWLEGTGSLWQDSHQTIDDVIKQHKTSNKKKFESLFEGIKTEENKTLLNSIYTQLYIIEGESEGVNEEHEVLQMEKTPRRRGQETPINCSDIFKPLQDHKGPRDKERKEDKGSKVPDVRSVLTKGIAGIGKTVSVQKFILDWAEGKVNQDIDFMFVLPFRELNLIQDHQYSLHGLLCDFHPELKDLDPKIYNEHKAVFLFDGLDESRISLNFSHCEKVSNITGKSSVGVLMTNLIKGKLLPSSLIWITCRPAAANQIPLKYISRVTEIQGFSDPQKEEYFRKRISDQDQAQKIISYIKAARSLHIMCHIPVFCWISATVLQTIMKQSHTEIPKTLTEMYSHFLITQTNMKNNKYEDKDPNDERDPKKLLESSKTGLLKLAELAFTQLMKGNVMFYEEDLRESGIDIPDASVYSGVFTEIFREECGIYQRKVYCFVHLSFQEFLAAVYVMYCYESKKEKVLSAFKPKLRTWVPLNKVLIGAVYKSLESQNGHLDLFLRFLLGISLESNQRLLRGLLTGTLTHSEKTTTYIKNLIKGKVPLFSNRFHSISMERSINLFFCLSEMKDQSLSREIQEYLNSEKCSKEKLAPEQCSALACMLLTSEKVLEELCLMKYNTSEEGYMRLIPAVTICRRAVLAGCDLTKTSCETLCSALQAVNSSLKELDLSNNNLQDSGVKLLSAGLKSSHCELQILRLSGCMITEEGCYFLAAALKSNPSHLRELDLTYNHPGESGVKELSDLLEDPHCKLEKLLVEHGGEHSMKPGIKKYACQLTLDPNTAHSRLFLPKGNRKVEHVIKDQPYPEHPDRFGDWEQVLSVESLTGRCYWEVERREGWGADIAVSYRGIKRKGRSADSRFGSNNQSWCVRYYNNRYSVHHNNMIICESLNLPLSDRVGMFVDWPAGILSFYIISPNTYTLTCVHTLHITFTEPLYAGFCVSPYSTVLIL